MVCSGWLDSGRWAPPRLRPSAPIDGEAVRGLRAAVRCGSPSPRRPSHAARRGTRRRGPRRQPADRLLAPSTRSSTRTEPATHRRRPARASGTALVTSVGGASGPLYGAAFIEAGFAARAMERLGVEELADARPGGGRWPGSPRTMPRSATRRSSTRWRPQPTRSTRRRGDGRADRRRRCGPRSGGRATRHAEHATARRTARARACASANGRAATSIPGAVSCFLLRPCPRRTDGAGPMTVRTAVTSPRRGLDAEHRANLPRGPARGRHDLQLTTS